jgi:hypothetical protein
MSLAPQAKKPEIRTFKQVGCGCCELWARHMRAAGYTVTITEAPDLPAIKRQHGVPPQMESCHTSLVGGYVVEGHVPSDVVDRMLAEKPRVKGIAVPGMPMGSPGMEQGGRADSYKVLTFDATGATTVFATR